MTLVVHQATRTYLGKPCGRYAEPPGGVAGRRQHKVRTSASPTCGSGDNARSSGWPRSILLYSINPFIGLPLTLRYLCIIVLRLGSLFGSLVGGDSRIDRGVYGLPAESALAGDGSLFDAGGGVARSSKGMQRTQT